MGWLTLQKIANFKLGENQAVRMSAIFDLKIQELKKLNQF